MKLPRDVNGIDFAKALGVLGYAITRQKGSHIHHDPRRGRTSRSHPGSSSHQAGNAGVHSEKRGGSSPDDNTGAGPENLGLTAC